MRDFRRLRVWVRAREFTTLIYRVTSTFPDGERFGLTSQMRRSCVSIMSNIAEGTGRATDADYARFLDMALGSANEVECQLMIASDLLLIEEGDAAPLIEEVDHIRRQLLRLKSRVHPQGQRPDT